MNFPRTRFIRTFIIHLKFLMMGKFGGNLYFWIAKSFGTFGIFHAMLQVQNSKYCKLLTAGTFIANSESCHEFCSMQNLERSSNL